MKTWLKLMAAALATGLVWAGVWAAAGALIGIVAPDRVLSQRWVGPPIGIHPGFVGGVMFAVVLGIATRPRRFDEQSFSTAVACGAMVGLFLGILPLAINEPPGESPLWIVAAVVVGTMVLMGAVSAAGSLALARTARRMTR